MHLFAFPLGGFAAQTMTEEVGSGGAVAVSCRRVERASVSPAATAMSWVVFSSGKGLPCPEEKSNHDEQATMTHYLPTIPTATAFPLHFAAVPHKLSRRVVDCCRWLPSIAAVSIA